MDVCVCVCVGSSLYRPLDDLYYVFFREKIKRRKVFILSWLRFISWLYAAYYIVNVHNLYIFIFCAVYCSWCCVHSFLFSKFRQIYISFSPESFFFCFITLGSVYETVRSNHSSQNVILKFNIASIIHSSANFGFMFHFTSWFFCLLCFFLLFYFFRLRCLFSLFQLIVSIQCWWSVTLLLEYLEAKNAHKNILHKEIVVLFNFIGNFHKVSF